MSETSPRPAMAAWKAGNLPGWALMRALVSHRTWHVPATPDEDGEPAPSLARGDDGPALHAFSAVETRDAAGVEQSVSLTGAGLFGAVHDGLEALVLDPGTPHAVEIGPEKFADVRQWAAIDRVTRIVRGLDPRPDAWAFLRAYDGWIVLSRPTPQGRQMMLAPGGGGRKLAAVFTAEDTLRAFFARAGKAIEGQGLELQRVDGATLFAELAQSPLDGIVFDCAGPLPPKAVALQFAHEVLADAARPTGQAAAMTAARRIADQARPLLARFADPAADGMALVAQLIPRSGDALAVFRAEIAGAVERAYFEMMSQVPPLIEVKPGQTQVEVFACPAGFFGQQNALTRPFPGGYAKLGPYLDPTRVWLTWRYTAPGATRGMAYNGLVWIDDHWAWFPKPYRVVGQLVDG